jgi:hypothetical protein
MSELPVARKLDFSNIGAPEPKPNESLSSIVFPSLDNESLPEQTSVRVRRDPTESVFAIGHGPFSSHPRPVRRSPVEQNANQCISRILIGKSGRNFTIKNKDKSLFNPMTLDEFYAQSCPPGHVRIFRQLLPVGYGLVDSPSYIQYANLMVTLPFNKFKKYIDELTYPFEKLYSSKATYSSNFNTWIEQKCCVDKYSYNEVWHRFAKIRYQMRRLANAFLLKKSMKKMMAIPNYITMEDPSPSNCIEWPDIQNRCSYRIHGDTLLNSMKMYLHHSEYGFPEPLWPKNPTTNAPFTYGQLIHLIYELYAWCGRNKKAVPYVLTKFQEADYCLSKLIIKNRPELTLYACRELFTEINQPDAIEMWLDMVEEYAVIYSSTSRDELEDEIPRWLTSLSSERAYERKQALEYLKKWSSIIPDLVQLSRFKYFNRTEWANTTTVKKIVNVLWAKTYHLIRKFIQSRKTHVIPHPHPQPHAPASPSSPASTSSTSSEEVEDLLPPALDNTAILSEQALANIQILLSGLNQPSYSNFEFRISSEWTSILDESSATNDAPSAVELEYNMMMFNNIINPPTHLLIDESHILNQGSEEETQN